MTGSPVNKPGGAAEHQRLEARVDEGVDLIPEGISDVSNGQDLFFPDRVYEVTVENLDGGEPDHLIVNSTLTREHAERVNRRRVESGLDPQYIDFVYQSGRSERGGRLGTGFVSRLGRSLLLLIR